jgi:hypothetical protein
MVLNWEEVMGHDYKIRSPKLEGHPEVEIQIDTKHGADPPGQSRASVGPVLPTGGHLAATSPGRKMAGEKSEVHLSPAIFLPAIGRVDIADVS